MERFNALGRGAQIMLVSGVLFLISTFFNWQSVDLGVAEVGQNAWHGFWGVVMGLLAIVLIAWLVARLAGVEIPIPFSAALIGAALAVLIFVFALLKNLTDDFTSAWAWIGLALARGAVGRRRGCAPERDARDGILDRVLGPRERPGGSGAAAGTRAWTGRCLGRNERRAVDRARQLTRSSRSDAAAPTSAAADAADAKLRSDLGHAGSTGIRARGA